jgi:hypothetical protein
MQSSACALLATKQLAVSGFQIFNTESYFSASCPFKKQSIGEVYFLAGEPICYHDMLKIWHKRPGGAENALFLPSGLIAASFAPLEPLKRRAGLSAFMSRESVEVAKINLNYSGEKAYRELAWTHRSADEMWLIKTSYILSSPNLASKMRNSGT